MLILHSIMLTKFPFVSVKLFYTLKVQYENVRKLILQTKEISLATFPVLSQFSLYIRNFKGEDKILHHDMQNTLQHYK